VKLTRNPSKPWLVALSAAVVVSVIGCGKSDRPPLAKAGGMVLLQGQPLPSGRVTFIPDRSRGTMGRAATGIIQPDGRFTLQSYADGDGAIVGFHRVAIESWEEVTPSTPAITAGADDVPAPPPPRKSRIATRYNDHATSGITAEVQAGSGNEFEFSVESR
jgi:hypothetical protein